MRLFPSVFLILILPLILQRTDASAQARVTTIGLSYKPIFPVGFLGTSSEQFSQQGVQLDLGLNRGFSGGMSIRRGFSELISAEIGINYTKRTYQFTLTDSAFSESSDFRIIGYEIPASVLVFVQLGEQLFMNASMGAGVDAFASSVSTSDYYYEQVARRRMVFLPAINANLGWEFRTSKSGIIYLGATYHRPFQNIYYNSILYSNNGKIVSFENELSGSYLTADLRYYFHEDPDVKRKKKK